MHKKQIKNLDYFGRLCFLVCLYISKSEAQCPWQADQSSSELQSSCICSTNIAKQLSVQCDLVNYDALLQTLDKYSQNMTLDLLYINNSSVKRIDDSTFSNLKIHNLQMSGCQIQTISPMAFKGLEPYLRHLSLQDNKIEELPISSIEGLINLTLLDLSRNRIFRVPDDAFVTLKNIQTIKLADNNLTLSKNAFRGLENSLKNLNLKGTNQKSLPECIRNLKNLAFLDLAQNVMSELPGISGHIFQGLGALTALNLERNVIQSLGESTFDGVKNTLSSLSLLNNLLTEYPTVAISKLPELRVLDLGFNLITEIPNDAFLANPSLTLLALDGNPIETIPKKAFTHLNTTLRGLSLGGRYLQCDCRIRWVIEWIKNGDLQVTSRERNPQFCASPSYLKNKHLYQIDPLEMVCDNESSPSDASTILETSIDEDDVNSQHPLGTGVGYVSPTIVSAEIPTSNNNYKKNPPIPEVEVVDPSNSSELLGHLMDTTKMVSSTTESTTTMNAIDTTTKYFVQNTTNIKPTSSTRKTNLVITRPQLAQTSQKPPLILGSYPKKQAQEVIIRSVHRQDNSVIIQWDSETANILGFRVVYRLFGDRTFKQGPPLETSEREFKIKNVPYQECIIVCVISLEELNISPDTVPYSQCREIRTAVTMTSNMDRITIAASAAICGTVLIAVVVFIAASKRRAKKLQSLHNSMASCHTNKVGVPVGTLPVNGCYSASGGPNAGPMSSLAALSAFNGHKDWDQGSVYSNRSLNPSRMYRVADGRQGNEDLHSNISNFSSKPPKMRSVADGQSQNSFSNNSMRYLGGSNAYSSDLVNSRPELRQSRQSLAVSERMSHISYPGSARTNTSRNKPRQRSRTREQGTQNRPPSRYSHGGSHHNLNSYGGGGGPGDTSDNWTDHDIDIYMTRNPTARNGGLVPL